MTTRYMVPLENQTTSRLNTWLSNVKQTKREYEEDSHGSFCRHCAEAKQVYKDLKIYDKCQVCIWRTLEGHTCWRVDLNNDFVSNTPTHNKAEHIARCTKWINILEKELERRNKNA